MDSTQEISSQFKELSLPILSQQPAVLAQSAVSRLFAQMSQVQTNGDFSNKLVEYYANILSLAGKWQFSSKILQQHYSYKL